MCGYFGSLRDCSTVQDLMVQLELPLPYPQQRAYQRRPFDGLVTQQGNTYQASSALWWYALRPQEGEFVVNEKLTSFNARDLNKPLWQEASRTRRALVFATELGESQGKDRYLMRSKEGFALGCVYKDWQDSHGKVTRSFAVITRPPHHRFEKYHHKSLPLFLPMDDVVIKEWLNPGISDSLILQELLDEPRLLADFEVTKVKSYKHAEALAAPEWLEKDIVS